MTLCTLYMYEYCTVCTSCTVVVVCVCVETGYIVAIWTVVEECLLSWTSSNYIHIHPTALKEIDNFTVSTGILCK